MCLLLFVYTVILASSVLAPEQSAFPYIAGLSICSIFQGLKLYFQGYVRFKLNCRKLKLSVLSILLQGCYVDGVFPWSFNRLAGN